MNDYDSIFGTEASFTKWEDIPVSQLNFNSPTSQICYVAISKNIIEKRISEVSLPKNTVAYEYKENINLKNNEVIVAVEIDTSNMYDTTNLLELKNGNVSKAPLIRTVQPITKLGVTNYIIIYRIIDNRAVKNIFKI